MPRSGSARCFPGSSSRARRSRWSETGRSCRRARTPRPRSATAPASRSSSPWAGAEVKDALVVAGKSYSSRLLVGTGKYRDFAETRAAVEASGAQIVTVAIRRTNIGQNRNEPSLLDALPPSRFTYLPNTAGCYTAADAGRTLRLARELLDGHDLVKLEVLGDPHTLYPNMPETLSAAETLVKEGFKVMVYCSDDPIQAQMLEKIGCVAVMPLASLIGSGMGILNPWILQLTLEKVKVPVLVDAGVDQHRDLHLLEGELQDPRIEDAHPRADERGERHDRDAADLLQHLRLDRVVGAVHHHLEPFFDQGLGRGKGLGHVGIQRVRVAEHLELHEVVSVEQLARQAERAYCVGGGVAAGGIGQVREPRRRQRVEQARLVAVLADVGAADGDGNDLGAGCLDRRARLGEVAVLAGADEQARRVALAGDDERVFHFSPRPRRRRSRGGRRRRSGSRRARSSARSPRFAPPRSSCPRARAWKAARRSRAGHRKSGPCRSRSPGSRDRKSVV